MISIGSTQFSFNSFDLNYLSLTLKESYTLETICSLIVHKETSHNYIRVALYDTLTCGNQRVFQGVQALPYNIC